MNESFIKIFRFNFGLTSISSIMEGLVQQFLKPAEPGACYLWIITNIYFLRNVLCPTCSPRFAVRFIIDSELNVLQQILGQIPDSSGRRRQLQVQWGRSLWKRLQRQHLQRHLRKCHKRDLRQFRMAEVQQK